MDSYRELLVGEKQQMKIFELASEFLAERQVPKVMLSKLRRKPIVILAGYVCICLKSGYLSLFKLLSF